MPHQPVSSDDLKTYGLPALSVMRASGAAGKVMMQITRLEEAAASMHFKMVIIGACRRYVASLHMAQDPKAYAAFAKDPAVTKLKRPLKGPDDTFRAVWQATLSDPKLASKRFKRLKHLWNKRAPVSEVEKLLTRYGWEKPIPGITTSKKRSSETEDIVSGDAGDADSDGRDPPTAKQTGNDRLPTVTIKGVPRHFKAQREGSFSMRGSVIKQVGDTLTIGDAVFDT